LAVGGLALVTCSPGTTLFEIIKKYSLAIAIPPDNPEVFWEMLLKIAQDNNMIAQIKAAAQDYARHHLDKEMIIDSFLNKLD
jgi:colanic acid biosynthesis glycosyl transferase WcaI